MDMDAPSTPQYQLIDKPDISKHPVQEQNPYFKVTVQTPNETVKVVVTRARTCFTIAITFCLISLAFFIPLYQTYPYIGPSVSFVMLIIFLCLLKRNYVILKDKNTLYISTTNYFWPHRIVIG